MSRSIRPSVIHFDRVPVYSQYTAPLGFLVDEVPCQALFHYATLAAKAEHLEFNAIEYESVAGERTGSDYNYEQLMRSVAMLYGTEPERMVRFWANVDTQFAILGFNKVWPAHRFDQVPDIKTETEGEEKQMEVEEVTTMADMETPKGNA